MGIPRTVGRLEGVCWVRGRGRAGQLVCGSDDLLVCGETFGV